MRNFACNTTASPVTTATAEDCSHRACWSAAHAAATPTHPPSFPLPCRLGCSQPGHHQLWPSALTPHVQLRMMQAHAAMPHIRPPARATHPGSPRPRKMSPQVLSFSAFRREDSYSVQQHSTARCPPHSLPPQVCCQGRCRHLRGGQLLPGPARRSSLIPKCSRHMSTCETGRVAAVGKCT